MKLENPLDETVQNIQGISFIDFDRIELKFKKTFYRKFGVFTDRTNMKITELEMFETWMKSWIDTYLVMKNGLMELTIPKTGKYQFILQSRSSNRDWSDAWNDWNDASRGPAMGVNVELVMDLKKGDKVYVFLADTVFLFDEDKKLISVPGAAGYIGNHLCNGSITKETKQSDQFNRNISKIGYDPQSVLNGTNRKWSGNGSGYKVSTRYQYRVCVPGGSTFVHPEYKSTVKQNTEVPQKGSFTVPFLKIKLEST